jgi:Kdo2-lipid IVA lauroyltransferase/acyltransferase
MTSTSASLALLYALFGAIARVLRWFDWRRAMVDRHLSRCLPELDAARREDIATGFYRYLGEFAAEAVHSRRLTREELAARVHFENPECVTGVLANDRGRVMILSAHHANWEWLLLRCTTAFGVPLTAAYKPLRNPRLERRVRAIRERFGASMVPAKRIVQHLLEQRGKVRLLAMLADQSPAAVNEQQSWLDFFGQSTSFFRGPEWIASKLGYTVFLAAMRRERRGQYTVRFIELYSPASGRTEPDHVLQCYARQLETHVRACPEQYFWAYNRWKREKPLYG